MSILKRTVYYDVNGGVVRFLDWAKVTTTLGAMAEPHMHSRRTADVDVIDYDFEDQIARIDQLKQVDARQQNQIISGSEYALIGGHTHPRVGR